MITIKWKGIDSTTIPGLIICELPPITKPKMKTSIISIDGRDGDIIEEKGYESYVKTITIGLTHNYDINQVIKYFTGSGELILSNESDKIYKSQIIDKIDYEKLLRFKTAKVKFYTQPYKYKYNENKVILNVTSQTSLNVNNVGLEASKPIIKLTGSGIIGLSINNTQILNYTFSGDDSNVIIDSEQEEAYYDGIYKNRNMTGSFPILQPGQNTISWSGTLTKIEVEPKSRWL